RAPWMCRNQPRAGRAAVEREPLEVLERLIGRACEQRRRGVPDVQVGTLPGSQFETDAAIATPLGPRDDAWLARASKDAWAASDIRPWWFDATDARYLLNRALVILWT